MIKSELKDVTPYETRDGSRICELMHPAVHGNHRQSLAQATVAPGQGTRKHRHHRSEEIYHVISGTALLLLDEVEHPLRQGDTVCIPPGMPHQVRNTGKEELVFLCCCSPPYSHEDTELLAPDA